MPEFSVLVNHYNEAIYYGPKSLTNQYWEDRWRIEEYEYYSFQSAMHAAEEICEEHPRYRLVELKYGV